MVLCHPQDFQQLSVYQARNRVENATRLGICSCKASGAKWREVCREKILALSSFVSWGKMNSKISPEISRQFPWRLPRAVPGQNFTAALPQAMQRRESSLNIECLGGISHGRPGGYLRWRPDPKNFHPLAGRKKYKWPRPRFLPTF